MVTSIVELNYAKKRLVLNALAVESLNFDVKDSKCMIVSPKRTEEANTNSSLYIVNINRSCILEELKDAESYIHETIKDPSSIRDVKIDDDGNGIIEVNDRILDVFKMIFKNKTEFKIIPQSAESIKGGDLKEFVENFEIKETPHKIVSLAFKNNYIGKSKEEEESKEEKKIKLS